MSLVCAGWESAVEWTAVHWSHLDDLNALSAAADTCESVACTCAKGSVSPVPAYLAFQEA